MFQLDWPVKEPVRISQRFGVNRTGVGDFYTRWGLPAHEGVDFGGQLGDPIYAAADATIIAINIPGKNGVVPNHAYGIHIKLKHADNNGQVYESDYCHLLSVDPAIIKRPDFIPVGTIIGYMGKSGNANNQVHLHFMLRKAGATVRQETQKLGNGKLVVYKNDIVNPEPYFL